MSKNISKTAYCKEQGFSLVETLVAITILLIVIIGPLTISSQSARSTSFASEQVIAFFLAQEGLEIVRKERDDQFIRGFNGTASDPWDTFTADFSDCFSTNGCGVRQAADIAGDTVVSGTCPTDGCQLYFDDDVNSALRSRYTTESAGNIDTPYSRSVTMEEIIADEEIRIVSTVFWRNSDQREIQSVTVESYLFNIYGQ